MSDVPAAFPAEPGIYRGSREERFVAVALETLIHDMSPIGDGDMAAHLGGYALGEEPAPEGAPEYVDLDDGEITFANPPFLLGEVSIRTDGDAYRLDFAFDSELKLLIDPPVCVTLEGSLGEVVDTMEQMIAEIYRTKGRRLEMLDSGVVDTDSFTK